MPTLDLFSLRQGEPDTLQYEELIRYPIPKGVAFTSCWQDNQAMSGACTFPGRAFFACKRKVEWIGIFDPTCAKCTMGSYALLHIPSACLSLDQHSLDNNSYRENIAPRVIKFGQWSNGLKSKVIWVKVKGHVGQS